MYERVRSRMFMEEEAEEEELWMRMFVVVLFCKLRNFEIESSWELGDREVQKNYHRYSDRNHEIGCGI